MKTKVSLFSSSGSPARYQDGIRYLIEIFGELALQELAVLILRSASMDPTDYNIPYTPTKFRRLDEI